MKYINNHWLNLHLETQLSIHLQSNCLSLVELSSFQLVILYNQNLKEPHAVFSVMIDFSKAFNRQDHNILLTLLCNLGVPGWLLNIVASFLQNRELILSYQGCTAKSRKLPGGGPQGTVLGMFLFIVLINLVGFENQDKQVGKTSL